MQIGGPGVVVVWDETYSRSKRIVHKKGATGRKGTQKRTGRIETRMTGRTIWQRLVANLNKRPAGCTATLKRPSTSEKQPVDCRGCGVGACWPHPKFPRGPDQTCQHGTTPSRSRGARRKTPWCEVVAVGLAQCHYYREPPRDRHVGGNRTGCRSGRTRIGGASQPRPSFPGSGHWYTLQ